jgi:hypothetical protein
MSAQATTLNADSTTSTAQAKADTPPGQKPMGAIWIALVAIYLILISIVVLYGLLKLWPHPTPSGEPREDAVATAPASASAVPSSSPATNGKTALPDPERIYFLGGRYQADIYAETRLLLIVMLAGGLGSLLHSLRSLSWYTGNREMVWSWALLYVLLPFTGAILATIFYFVVRGGFFSPQASFENTSPFGFAALSALVGLFSPQAVLKLKDVAETVFTKPGAGADSKTQESVSASQAPHAAPTISSITPVQGSTSGEQPVTIAGTGFASNPTVLIGNLPAKIVSSTATSINATTPPSATGATVVDVEVSNPDGKKATLSQGYTYVVDGDGTTSNGDEGAG